MEEKTKNSFVMYMSWNNAIQTMTDEQAGKLLKMIYRYQLENPEYMSDDPVANVMFQVMKERFDPDRESWQRKLDQKRAAGQASAEARRNGTQRNPTTVNDRSTEPNDRPSPSTVYEYDYESVYEYGSESGSESALPIVGRDIGVSGAAGQSSRKRFVKPSLEDVSAYCYERGNQINPQSFIDYYDSNGWKVGKNPMKDWKAAVRSWEQRSEKKTQPAAEEHEAYMQMWRNA